MNAGILLINPKFPHNVGNTLRACAAWDAPKLRWTGDRVIVDEIIGRLPREERMRAYKDAVDWKRAERSRPIDEFPGLTPVAVELKEGVETLPLFEHPENALYIFGPEDGSIGSGVLSACHRFVALPTTTCLNLAAAVNVVLYDRHAKLKTEQRIEDVLARGA